MMRALSFASYTRQVWHDILVKILKVICASIIYKCVGAGLACWTPDTGGLPARTLLEAHVLLAHRPLPALHLL